MDNPIWKFNGKARNFQFKYFDPFAKISEIIDSVDKLFYKKKFILIVDIICHYYLTRNLIRELKFEIGIRFFIRCCCCLQTK